MNIICTRKNYQLRCRVTKFAEDLYSVDFDQLWPEAQHPHWRHVAQFNLTSAELANLGEVLLHEAQQ